MTEENTDPDTAYQEALDRTCSNWTVPANRDQSRCALDGSPCGTKDCPHNSPHTGHNAPTPTGGDECDNDCTHDGDPAPKDSPTPEEIMTAYNHLQELVNRADTHAICIITMDAGEFNAFRMEVSNNIKINKSANDPTPGMPWLSIMGHAWQMNQSLARNYDSITEGLHHYLENMASIERAIEQSRMDDLFRGNTPTAH